MAGHPLLGVTVGFFYFFEIYLKEDLWKSEINNNFMFGVTYITYVMFVLICKETWQYPIW